MQGYMWTSNQPARYQEQPSASYQEQHPPPYHQHFQPNYQAVRNGQPNSFQAQYNPQIPQNQHYATTQARFSNGQQQATNQWSSSSNSNNCFAPTFQSNSHGYDQTRQPNPGQYQYTTSNRQQQYSSEKPNTYVYCSQLNTQANASSTQNYRNTDCSQAPMNWTSQSNSGNSVGNNRALTNHNSKNGSSCSINNQQQLQPYRRTSAQHHQHQQFSKQQSVKWQKKHQSRQRSQLIFTTKGRKDQTATNQTSSNSVTPPSGAHNNVTLPVSNQSPVNQNQPELRVNPGPAVSQSQSYQSAGDQCQGINSGVYNAMQTTQANGANCRFVGSIIYHLLCSDSDEKTNTLQSNDIIAHQNTVPHPFEGFANKRTDHSSKEQISSQCTVEPPSKRIKHGVAQTDYWNKETSVSNDRSDSLPGTHLTDSHENRLKRTSQHTIQYSTDPADCLEAVLALKKAGHQSHKAIAIVPPITQQALNDAQTVDEILKKADSPPLKIDSVWSLDKESDAQKIASDFEPPSQTTQDDKSIENEAERSTEKPDTCCITPTECQKDASELSFDLSNVPVTEYTIEDLTDLVETLEMTELSAGYPEQPESVLDTILKLYWNGKEDNIRDTLISFRKHAPQFYKGIEIDWDSVVLKTIETQNLEKLAHCSVLKNEKYSSSEEFKSSWLNVDGQPADIEKVLLEPMLEDSTEFQTVQETDNTGLTSLNKGVNLPQILPSEKSVKPNMSIFTPLAGNGQEEAASENNGPYEDTSLSKKQMQSITAQSHTLNAKSSFIAPLVKRLTEKPTMGSMDSLSPIDKVSDGANTLCNSTDTWSISKAPNPSSDVLQVGDTDSDCKNPGIKEALNNSSETWLVENISDDENSGKKEVPLIAADVSDDEHVEDMGVLLNTSDIWLVEDISDDVNSGKRDTLSDPSDKCVVEDVSNEEKSEDKVASPNTSEIWQVEDISDDEDSDSKNTHNDTCVVEGVSNDNKTEDKEVSPNTSDIWLVEDISDDEDPGNKDALNDPSDIRVVEDVSNEKKSEDKEVSPNTSEIWQVEDISDDEDSGNKDTHNDPSDICVVEDVSNEEKSEVSPNASEIWEVEDISENESSDNVETLSESSDIRVLDGTSNDENSSDEPFLMKMTVLSSEDAQTFFQHFGDEPECTVETKSQSNLDRPACLDVPTEPNHEYNQTNICSLCSTTTTATMMNNDGFCLRCWEQAPLLELEEESEAEAEVPGSPAKSNDQCENCSPPCLKVKEPETCIAKEGLTEQKSAQGENCCPPLLELQVGKPTVALLGACNELDQNLSPPFLEPEVLKSPKLKQIHSFPSPKLKVKKPTEECFGDEVLTGLQRESMVMSEQGPNRSSPSSELNAKESNCALSKTRTEEPTVQKGDFMEVLELKRSKTDSTEQHKGLTLQKCDSMVKTVTKALPKKQKSANPELNKIRLKKIKFIFTKPQLKKTPASSNNKVKSASTTPDECVLFAPDIVIKKNYPGVPAKKCPSVTSQNANKVKKFKEHRQERKYKNSHTHRENVQKVTEKVPNHSNESPVHTSKRKSNGILSVHKAKMIEPKKVRFDLYGSKTEELYYAKERRFSPPATLTVSDSCSDYTDVLSAKQKVHSLWSSTFIPPKKSSPSRSHQEGKPQKTKTMKPQDLLKSNMNALKSHLTHRAMLLSYGEMSHFRKPFSSRQKLTKTLSS